MKKINSVIRKIFVACSLLLLSNIAAAQIQQYLSIDNDFVLIDNLALVDSMGANNKMVHNASFDVSINNSPAVIIALQTALKDNKQLNLSFSKVVDGQLREERKYSPSIIKSLQLPELNATSKSLLKLRVTLQAAEVNITYTNTLFKEKIAKGIALNACNYKLTLGSLPTKRVSKISGLQPGKNSAQNFSVEIMAIDEQEWNEWYANGAGKRIKSGTIELLAPNFKDVLFTIELSDMFINAYSTSSSGNTIAKSTYGLSVAAIKLNAK